MSRLAPLDKALVLILVPIWVVCFGFVVKTQIDGTGAAFFGLSVADAHSYPVVTGEFQSFGGNPLDQAGLRAGDQLVRVGDADLLGVGTRGFMGLSSREAGPDLRVAVLYERDGERRETSLRLESYSLFLPGAVASFTFAVLAIFLLLRAEPTPTVRAYSYAAFCFAFMSPFTGGPLESTVSVWVQVAANTLLLPLSLRALFLFPDDRAPEGRWSLAWPWCFAVLGPLWAFAFVGGRFGPGVPAISASFALGSAAAIGVVTHKYRRGDPIARRQIRWVLVGVYFAALPFAATGILVFFEPEFGWLMLQSFWALSLVPVFLLVSILRFNLFDVDRILSATASYNVLLALLGAGALVVVPRLAEAVSGVAGVDPGTGQVVLSLALAAAVIPAHRRLRPQIDRVFFKERYALDHGIAELLPALSACSDVRELTERAGAGLHSLLRPEACVVYAGVEGSYVPVFAEGRAVPPAFEAGSSLIVALQGRRAPLSLSEAGRRPDEASLGPFDRAALETLQAEVVIPVRQEDALVAFVCLGPKRSGDVYTSTDLSLLTAVAETVAHQLRRFDQDAVTREAQEMQESLRRYVPGAIAEQLAGGSELASGEREVTVLFVDIRGYTGFSESRRAEEIFSTVNRYTETVSQLVRRHGGSVVEFNGDGMMAVFGAPHEIAHKERAAVESGREIVEAVAALPVEATDGAVTQLSVGVGIATGEAFVGNIQAVDRMIWTAIGNTTNLAARLQGLTRDLNATMVIDSPTCERAQPAAVGFENRPDVPVRGRRETQDVYVLPMLAS